MSVDAIIGLQRGDEGKGGFVDRLAAEYDIVARFSGGSNAGHTIILPDGDVLKLHQVPAGIIHPGVMSIIGNGVYLDPVKLQHEIEHIQSKGIEISPANLKISSAAHLVLPHHISLDEIRESGTRSQGSTKSGIAPVGADKYGREGIRAELIKNQPDDIFTLVYEGLKAQSQMRKEAGLEPMDEEQTATEYIESAKKIADSNNNADFITDTVWYIKNCLERGAKILAEGAQAFLLDIEHGMYPYVTSSLTTTAGVVTGLGIPPGTLNKVMGVTKAVHSHVGGGPFVTEIDDSEIAARLHGDKSAKDAEFGATTGRERRLGYLDLPQLRRANWINGTTEMIVTKLDWLNRFDGAVQVCVAYDRRNRDGENRYVVAPDSARKLEQCLPIYEELPGWEEDIQDVRSFEDLPKNAQKYVEFLERQLDVPISMIGVGPERHQVIVRS